MRSYDRREHVDTVNPLVGYVYQIVDTIDNEVMANGVILMRIDPAFLVEENGRQLMRYPSYFVSKDNREVTLTPPDTKHSAKKVSKNIKTSRSRVQELNKIAKREFRMKEE